MTENNYKETININYKETIDIRRLLLKKATSISEANKLGNQMFRLKNQRLKYLQIAAVTEKQLLEITVKANKIDFVKEIKK